MQHPPGQKARVLHKLRFRKRSQITGLEREACPAKPCNMFAQSCMAAANAVLAAGTTLNIKPVERWKASRPQ